MGDTTYTVRNDMGGIFNVLATSYSQVVAENTGGEERIIYDVNTAQTAYMWVMFIGITLFACTVVYIVLLQFKKRSNIKGRQNN